MGKTTKLEISLYKVGQNDPDETRLMLLFRTPGVNEEDVGSAGEFCLNIYRKSQGLDYYTHLYGFMDAYVGTTAPAGTAGALSPGGIG